MKYLVQCKFCGSILLKTNDVVVGVLAIEIKCPNPNCKKILKIPGDVIVNLEKEKRRGLEMTR